MGDASGEIEFGAAGQAAIDHHRHAIERDRGFGDGGGEHDTAAAGGIAADGGALGGGIDLAVQRQDRCIGQAFRQPFARALYLAHAGQEGEDIAPLLAPGGEHRAGHRILDPLFDAAGAPFDPQRMHAALALHHRRIGAEQAGETRAVDGGGHHDQPQIIAQHRLAFQREGEAEVRIEMAFVRLVEQHGGDAGQFLIGEDAIDEDRLGHDEDAGGGGAAAVEPGDIAGALADLLAQQLRDPLRRRARGDPARAEEEDRAIAPWLIEQRRRDGGGLACARRGDQHGRIARAQGGEQLRQDGVDREVGGHGPALAIRGGLRNVVRFSARRGAEARRILVNAAKPL